MAPAPQQPHNHQTSTTTSTSEDEEDSSHMVPDIPWQTVKGMKRKKHRTSRDSTTQDIPLDSKYRVLTDFRNDYANTGTADPKAAKPSIFVYEVTSFPEMRKRFNEFLDEEKYTTNSMAHDTIKLTCQNSDTHRKLAR